MWFDIYLKRCIIGELVHCDKRTPNKPGLDLTHAPEDPTDKPTDAPTDVPTDAPTPATEEPTKKPTEKPEEPPNLSSCQDLFHLFNYVTGDYIKSACFSSESSDYTTAQAACQSDNMELFVINDPIVEEIFRKINKDRAPFTGTRWINGKKEATGSWLSSEQVDLEDIDWVKSATVDGKTSGDCLRYTLLDGSYKAKGENCASKAMFTCEFNQSPMLHTEFCRWNVPLVDENGSLTKNVCIFNKPSKYFEAEQTCNNNGMHLFVVTDSFAQRAFVATIQKFLNGAVWVNGKRDFENKKWFVMDSNGRAPLSNNIDWYKTSTIDGSNSGDCLRYTNQNGPMTARGASCTNTAWFVCEH